MSMEELSPEIRELFENARPVEEIDQKAFARDVERIMAKPSFRAGVIKDQFIHNVLEAMEESGVTPSQLAKKWGKSRQYLSKILKEDRRVNYTVDTMVELMDHLGREVKVYYPRQGEHMMILNCLRREPTRPLKSNPAPKPVVAALAEPFKIRSEAKPIDLPEDELSAA